MFTNVLSNNNYFYQSWENFGTMGVSSRAGFMSVCLSYIKKVIKKIYFNIYIYIYIYIYIDIYYIYILLCLYDISISKY